MLPLSVKVDDRFVIHRASIFDSLILPDKKAFLSFQYPISMDNKSDFKTIDILNIFQKKYTSIWIRKDMDIIRYSIELYMKQHYSKDSNITEEYLKHIIGVAKIKKNKTCRITKINNIMQTTLIEFYPYIIEITSTDPEEEKYYSIEICEQLNKQ